MPLYLLAIFAMLSISSNTHSDNFLVSSKHLFWVQDPSSVSGASLPSIPKEMYAVTPSSQIAKFNYFQ
jgi:hypothetical protein